MGELLHDCPLVNYYLVVDLVIMITFLPYLYFARKFQVSQNVMRNLFTLNLVQKQKLQERRNDSSIKMIASDLAAIKSYFKKKEENPPDEEEDKKDRTQNKPGFYHASQGKLKKPKKKKFKSRGEEIAERLNEEIAKEEDETSESDDNDTETSSDEDKELKADSRF